MVQTRWVHHNPANSYTDTFYSVRKCSLWVVTGEGGEIQTTGSTPSSFTKRNTGLANDILSSAVSGANPLHIFCGATSGRWFRSLNGGLSWSSGTWGAGFAGAMRGAVWAPQAGEGLHVGDSGEVQSAADLLFYTQQRTATGQNLNAVDADGVGGLVAVGDLGSLYTALEADLTTWTLRSLPGSLTDNLTGVAYAAALDRYVVVGEGGVVLTSDDKGLTWDLRSLPDAVTTDLHDVRWSASAFQFIAVGAMGGIYVSFDGITWVKEEPDNLYLGTFYGCGIDDTNLNAIIVGSSGEIQVAPLTVPAAPTVSNFDPQISILTPTLGAGVGTSRWDTLQFDVVSQIGLITVLKVELVRSSGLVDLVYDQASGFTDEYALGSGVSNISMGKHLVVGRREGWPETPVHLRLTIEGPSPAVLA